jgi:hypothetical protein
VGRGGVFGFLGANGASKSATPLWLRVCAARAGTTCPMSTKFLPLKILTAVDAAGSVIGDIERRPVHSQGALSNSHVTFDRHQCRPHLFRVPALRSPE